MCVDSCFLSIDEDNPLAIWWGGKTGCGVIPLSRFFEDSKSDMSKDQAARYATAFAEFADELKRYSET